MAIGSARRRERAARASWATLLVAWATAWAAGRADAADPPTPVEVEVQPLSAAVTRLTEALAYLGSPLPTPTVQAVRAAIESGDARRLQQALDPQVALVVTVRGDADLSVAVGPKAAVLQQAGYTPLPIKVVNLAGAARPLRIGSPQAGPPYAGVAQLSMTRQAQPQLRENENVKGDPGRFLHLEMFGSPPLAEKLTGLRVEYVVALIYSSDAGRREAEIGLDLGGAGANVKLPLEIRPAVPVRLSIKDHDGRPTTARLTFRDKSGRVYPPQPRRLAPDLFFQPHIYRSDGGTVLLPPGELTLTWTRGPEYRELSRTIRVPDAGPATVAIDLHRWIDPAALGFINGDHHIHGAGCAHYSRPTEGVTPQDMFLQVKGEGLNVGCVLTWGPCYDFQRRYFSPAVDRISEAMTILKYDVEVSGFGSQALGHVCLLNLKDQTYPGSEGTKTKGWPTWTTPTLRWAKAQGAVTGYAHSASGLAVVPGSATRRLLEALDANKDGRLTAGEVGDALLPEGFAAIDADRDGGLSASELVASHERAAERLPNHAIPEMNSVGAMEISVSTAHGVCDFISAMNTPRIAEWNCWYHILNCGFPLKVSGETDFPCMSGTRVGQGRVYVKLGRVQRVDYTEWCEGLRAGRSYVSDGYAHAPAFAVAGVEPGGRVALERAGTVTVTAQVAFAPDAPAGVAYGGVMPAEGLRVLGDTVNLHEPRDRPAAGGKRKVELVVNGLPVGQREVPADGARHEVSFQVPIERSSWVALRHFPQMHTNPIEVIVSGKPIRAARKSALWCIGTIEQLWRERARAIAPAERAEADKTFRAAMEIYRKIAQECER
jgi:hypothetical protein